MTKKFKLNEKIEGYNPKMYRRMKIVYAALSIVNITVVLISFGLIGFSLYDAQKSYTCISRIENDVLKTNSDVMTVMLDPSTETAANNTKDIGLMFEDIAKTQGEFRSISSLDKDVIERFNVAYDSIMSYRTVLLRYSSQFGLIATEQNTELRAKQLAQFKEDFIANYPIEIEPLKNKSALLIGDVVEKQLDVTANIFYSTARSIIIVVALLISTLALGITAIHMMQRNAKRTASELQKRADTLVKTEEKLEQTRSKTRAIAYMNVLTGLKNRYALEEDLVKRLPKDDFHIANFDFDNFRSFNETYGRNFGDEFLALVAEQLKNEFSKYADIYNITSDEFTFVFKSTISGSQASHIVQKIQEVMTKSYTVCNVTVHLNVSGCTYHYIAGEYSSINSLLSKMDGVKRAAKNNGGNIILEAANI